MTDVERQVVSIKGDEKKIRCLRTAGKRDGTYTTASRIIPIVQKDSF
jgi:hypothetical protein